MKFRDFLNQQILNLVRNSRENLNYQNLKTEIFFSNRLFPSSFINYHHECPPFLLECQKQNVNVNLICIDPLYQDFLENTEIRIEFKIIIFQLFIYNHLITEDDYICLVEFCHFISNFSCLSIINEMTGIFRKQFYDKNHQTEYLFIGPSSCHVEVEDRFSCPLLKYKVNNKSNAYGHIDKITSFYWETYREVEKLYLEIDFGNLPKMKHLHSIIKHELTKISVFYLKIIDYLNLEEYQDLKKSNLVKNSDQFNHLLDSLSNRFNYDKIIFHKLRKEFEESDFISWDVFVKQKVSYILIAALHYKYKKIMR